MTIDEYNELQDQIVLLRQLHLDGCEQSFWDKAEAILAKICHIGEFNDVMLPCHLGKPVLPMYFRVRFEQPYTDEKGRTWYEVVENGQVLLRAKGVMWPYWFHNLSEQTIYEIIRNLGWMLEDNVRRCEKCGEVMMEGYYSDFLPYACGKECLLELFNGDEKAMQEALDNGDYVYKKFDSIF